MTKSILIEYYTVLKLLKSKWGIAIWKGPIANLSFLRFLKTKGQRIHMLVFPSFDGCSYDIFINDLNISWSAIYNAHCDPAVRDGPAPEVFQVTASGPWFLCAYRHQALGLRWIRDLSNAL